MVIQKLFRNPKITLDFMNIKDLKMELLNKNIPPDAYSLLISPQDESLVLESDGNNWCVFYYERGLRTEEKLFSIEEDACRYFFCKISSWGGK